MALSYIGRIYRIESEIRSRGLTADQLLAECRDKARPIFAEFFAWLSKRTLQVVSKSLQGIAVNYTLGQWNKLLVYLDHAGVSPDNNHAENAIRPFVVER